MLLAVASLVARAAETTHPYTHTNCGIEQTITATPTKVVSMNQATTEFLLAMGLHDNIVGQREDSTLEDPIWPRYAEACNWPPLELGTHRPADPLIPCSPLFLSDQKSGYYPTISGLFYSYATCGGDHSAFTTFELLQQASNQHQLVVVIPSIAYSPYHYKRDQPGGAPLTSSAPYELSHYRDDSVPWEGILVEYFAKLAGSSYTGLGSPKWVLTWTSASSRAQHTSSWTAAVNDVALGIADIGCSLFWMTAERLGMASFTANLLSDQFYLFVPKPKVDDG